MHATDAPEAARGGFVLLAYCIRAMHRTNASPIDEWPCRWIGEKKDPAATGHGLCMKLHCVAASAKHGWPQFVANLEQVLARIA